MRRYTKFTSRVRSAARPNLYGTPRATCSATSPLTSSGSIAARCSPTRTTNPSARARRRRSTACAITAAMRASPFTSSAATDSTAFLRVGRLRVGQLHLGHEVGQRDLQHRFLAQRRQHLRDVAQERAARADHHHLGARELRVVVEQVGGAVEADRGLAGAGPSLHGEHAGQRRPDHLVLFQLDGGDDVEHHAGAGPLELGQERVTAAQAHVAELLGAGAEDVVGDRQHAARLHHEVTATDQTASCPRDALGRRARPPVCATRRPRGRRARPRRGGARCTSARRRSRRSGRTAGAAASRRAARSGGASRPRGRDPGSRRWP